MTSYCSNCGDPADHVEEHHVDEQRGNNEPDNLTPRCRRCHHDGTHDNARAVDGEASRRFGPASPSTGPPSPK